MKWWKEIRTKWPNKLIIGEITLSGALYALFIIFRLIFKNVNILNTFSPQVQLIVLVLGVIILRTYAFKFLFILLSPFLTIIFGISGNIFFDYMLPCWGFIIFIFLSKLIDTYWSDEKIKKIVNKLIVYGFIFLFHIISYGLIMHLSYTISGIIFYHVPFIGSYSINAPVCWGSLAISLPIVIISSYPIYLIKGKFNKSIYY